jgi:Methyltransferase domain
MRIPDPIRAALAPIIRPPRQWSTLIIRPLRQWSTLRRGYAFSIVDARVPPASREESAAHPLQDFFKNRNEGPGIWKWEHYFDIYHRHFHRFRGQQVHVLEIGVYSGGSLDMWREYFGREARIYGVDLEPACKIYERNGVQIFVGDQADRAFWRRVRASIPALDIVIDDGGHELEQQIVTLEELLPFMRPGGVFLCEDLHQAFNRFATYVHGFSHRLNEYHATEDFKDNERRIVSKCTPTQDSIASVHLYPYVVVIEKTIASRKYLKAPKHGTEWQTCNDPWLEMR